MILYIPLADKLISLKIDEYGRLSKKFMRNLRTTEKSSKPIFSIEIEVTNSEKPIYIQIKSPSTGIICVGKKRKSIDYHALNFFFLTLVQFLSLKHNIILLHASAIVVDNSGHIFLGPSGAGKSTITSFIPPTSILADDCVVLKKEKREYVIYPSSFDRTKAPKITCIKKNLNNIYILKKSDKTYLEKCSEEKVKNILLRSNFCYMYLRKLTRDGIAPYAFINNKNLFEWTNLLIRRVPTSLLYFQKNSSFMRLLRSVKSP